MESVFCTWGKSRPDPTIRINVQPAPGTSPFAGGSATPSNRNNPMQHNGRNRPTVPDNKGYQIFQVYFRFLYYICTSTYDADHVAKTFAAKLLHWIIFGILCALSLTLEIEEIKGHTLGYTKSGDIFSYLSLGYYVVSGCVRMLFLYFVAFKYDKILELYDQLGQTPTSTDKRIIHLVRSLPPFIILLTIIDAIGRSVFTVVPFDEWSPEQVVKVRGYQVAYTFGFWSSATINNETLDDEHFRKYYLDWTLSNAALGMLGLSTLFWSCIHQNANICISLLCSVTMYCASVNLSTAKIAGGVLGFLDRQNDVLEEEAQKIWKEYIHLRRLSEKLEVAFGFLLKWNHLYYLLMLADFLLKNLNGNNRSLWFVLRCIQIVIVVLTYCFAVAASRKNKEYREWFLQTYKGKDYVVVDEHHIKTNIILEDITDHPIGVGSESFYIDDSFVMKFISVLASYFVFIADKSVQ